MRDGREREGRKGGMKGGGRERKKNKTRGTRGSPLEGIKKNRGKERGDHKREVRREREVIIKER